MRKETKNFIIESAVSVIVAATSFYAGVKAYKAVQDVYEEVEKKNGKECKSKYPVSMITSYFTGVGIGLAGREVIKYLENK